MLQFMGENKRILNMHEKIFSELENFQANTIVFQTNTNASLRNLETQVGQLAVDRILVCTQVHNTITKRLLSNPWQIAP